MSVGVSAGHRSWLCFIFHILSETNSLVGVTMTKRAGSFGCCESGRSFGDDFELISHGAIQIGDGVKCGSDNCGHGVVRLCVVN